MNEEIIEQIAREKKDSPEVIVEKKNGNLADFFHWRKKICRKIR